MRLTNNKFNGDIARSRFWNIPCTSANFLTFLPELNSTDDLLKKSARYFNINVINDFTLSAPC